MPYELGVNNTHAELLMKGYVGTAKAHKLSSLEPGSRPEAQKNAEVSKPGDQVAAPRSPIDLALNMESQLFSLALLVGLVVFLNYM